MVRKMTANQTNSLVFMDNYFNTHALFVELKQDSIHVIGTFKTDCIPKEVLNASAQFRKVNTKRKVTENNGVRLVECPTLCIECEGIYYLFIVDNKYFWKSPIG